MRACAALIVGLVVAFAAAEHIARTLRDRATLLGPYDLSGETAGGVTFGDPRGRIVMRHDAHLVFFPKRSQKLAAITINAQGFRGEDWKLAKAPGVQRVLVLGGSTVFGQGATNDAAAMPAVLERLLRAELGDDAVEVFNAGVIGYTVTGELVLFATRLLAYEPDLVVILNGWNDFHIAGRSPPHDERLDHPWFRDVDERIALSQRPFESLVYEWVESSVLLTRIDATLRWRAHMAPQRDFGIFADNMAIALPRYREHLTALVRLARTNGADVLVAPQPELFLRKGRIPERERLLRESFERNGYGEFSRAQYKHYVHAAEDVARSNRTHFVDTARTFDEVDDAVFVDAVHLDDLGLEFLARKLAVPVLTILNSRDAEHEAPAKIAPALAPVLSVSPGG